MYFVSLKNSQWPNVKMTASFSVVFALFMSVVCTLASCVTNPPGDFDSSGGTALVFLNKKKVEQ